MCVIRKGLRVGGETDIGLQEGDDLHRERRAFQAKGSILKST